MTQQLQHAWSSAAGNKAQQSGSTVHSPAETVALLLSVSMQLHWVIADSSWPTCTEMMILATAQEHPVYGVQVHTGNLSKGGELELACVQSTWFGSSFGSAMSFICRHLYKIIICI